MSPYLSREAEIIALAKAIRGASNPDEAIEAALAAGFTTEQIDKHLEAALDREFERKRLQLARAI
jgi:hypothetical protein